MGISKAVPFKWPFPPGDQAKAATTPRKAKPVQRSHKLANHSGKLADIVMVVCWGASIPGFMWLGAICGF